MLVQGWSQYQDMNPVPASLHAKVTLSTIEQTCSLIVDMVLSLNVSSNSELFYTFCFQQSKFPITGDVRLKTATLRMVVVGGTMLRMMTSTGRCRTSQILSLESRITPEMMVKVLVQFSSV